MSKALLAALVIISLLPFNRAFEDALRIPFLAIFGIELYVRFEAWQRRNEPQTRMILLAGAADVLAWLSFLPLELIIGEDRAQVVALIRLTRLLMLLRFGKGLARDIYTIMTRREQLQQFALVTGAVVALCFVSAVILAQLKISHDQDVAPHFVDQLWWSFRQVESADNLVPSLQQNPILVGLSLMLTVTGVFIISFIIGIGTTVVDQIVRTERLRALAYREHTIVTGPVHSSEVLIREFVRIYAKNRRIPSPEKLWTWLLHTNPFRNTRTFPRVALLGLADEPPAFLWEPLMADRRNRATFGTGASRAAGPSAWRGKLNTCSVRGPGRNLPPRTRRRRRRTNRRRRDVVQAS